MLSGYAIGRGFLLLCLTVGPLQAVTDRVGALQETARTGANCHLPPAYAPLAGQPEPARTPLQAMRIAIARAEREPAAGRRRQALSPIHAASAREPAAEPDRLAFLQAREEQLSRLRWLGMGMIGFLLLVLLMVWRQWRRDREAARREARLHGALRESHHQLMESHQTLKAVDNQRRSLLRATSHDLKTPLAAMVMLLDDIEDCIRGQGRSDGDLMPLVKGCREDLAHARGVIDRMVRMQQGESLLENMKPRPVRVATIVDQVLALNRPNAERKELSLESDLEADLVVQADAQALREILDNLVNNAIKYSTSGGVIEFRGFSGGGRVVLRVRDEGPGFQEADFDQLFRPFARLSAVPSDGESSTGLGLSIVKELAEAMGGVVTVRNRRPQGAVIEVSLPRTCLKTGAEDASSRAKRE
ncbi:MAG: ATP-binding protein [Opitutales bacterium]